MKLYDIAEAYRRIEQLVDDEGGYTEALNNITDEFDVKVENIAKLVREAEAEAKAFSDEAKVFTDKARYASNRAKHLKDYIYSNMAFTGRDKVQGKHLTIAMQSAPPSVHVDIGVEVPREYCRHIPEQWEPDKKALLDLWRQDKALPQGVNVIQSLYVRIK